MVIGIVLAVFVFKLEVFVVIGKFFVYSQVRLVFGGYQVIKLVVEQFVGNNLVIVIVDEFLFMVLYEVIEYDSSGVFYSFGNIVVYYYLCIFLLGVFYV